MESVVGIDPVIREVTPLGSASFMGNATTPKPWAD